MIHLLHLVIPEARSAIRDPGGRRIDIINKLKMLREINKFYNGIVYLYGLTLDPGYFYSRYRSNKNSGMTKESVLRPWNNKAK
jgi:hypothetical protein